MQSSLKFKRAFPWMVILAVASPFVFVGFLSAFVVGSFKGGWEAYTILIKRIPD